MLNSSASLETATSSVFSLYIRVSLCVALLLGTQEQTQDLSSSYFFMDLNLCLFLTWGSWISLAINVKNLRGLKFFTQMLPSRWDNKDLRGSY